MPICKYCGQEFSRSVFVHHLPWCEAEHIKKEAKKTENGFEEEITREYLETLNLSELRAVVEEYNLNARSRSKEELINEILSELSQRG